MSRRALWSLALPLAQSLDLPYQPGIAVVDADGKVVFTQLGASEDRAERVRRAIRSALAGARR